MRTSGEIGGGKERRRRRWGVEGASGGIKLEEMDSHGDRLSRGCERDD